MSFTIKHIVGQVHAAGAAHDDPNTVNNAGGNITANGGTVEVLNADIQGGTLNTLNGGALETAGSSILDGSTKNGLTLSQGSTCTGNTGTVTSVFGTITNHGTIQLIGGSNTNGYRTECRQPEPHQRQ